MVKYKKPKHGAKVQNKHTSFAGFLLFFHRTFIQDGGTSA